MARTPREVAEWIGEQYVEEYPRMPVDFAEYDRVKEAFVTMATINDRLFRDIPIPVEFQSDDPYDSYEEMADRVAEEQVLRVFDGGAEHPIWRHHAEVTSRAVHDWYGHLELDVPFTAVGEYRKWEHSRTHYPAYCDRVLFTEVIAQLGQVYYLDDGFADERYEQKVFAAPPEWIEEMARAVEEVDE